MGEGRYKRGERSISSIKVDFEYRKIKVYISDFMKLVKNFEQWAKPCMRSTLLEVETQTTLQFIATQENHILLRN